jgi:hypothetical protein
LELKSRECSAARTPDADMFKWLLTVLIVLVVFSAAAPGLEKLGWGRLPGDFRIPLRGRIVYVPFGSTVLLSLAVYLLGKII